MRKAWLILLAAAACSRQPVADPSSNVGTARQAVGGTVNWYTLPINYTRMGDDPAGTKKRVVLLHHSAMDSSEWTDVQTALAANYDVVAIDLFGHGKTPCPDKTVSIGMQFELVEAVMDSIGWTAAHMVGIDIGAQVAANMALRHPTRVQSLTVMAAGGLTAGLAPAYPGFTPPSLPVAPLDYNPLFYWPPVCLPNCPTNAAVWPPGSIAQTKFAYSTFLEKNKALVTDQFASDMFKKEITRSCLIANERMAREGTKNFGDFLYAGPPTNPVTNQNDVDPLTAIANIKAPTAIVWGDKDTVTNPAKWIGSAQAPGWAQIPGSTVSMLAGCGHDLPRDCPTEVAGALKTFIDAH